MSNQLNEICNILNKFEEAIAHIRTIWKGLEELNPHFEEIASENWPEKHHRLWLHGATEVGECNELEQRLYRDLPITETAQSPAWDAYKAWRKWLETAGLPKVSMALVYDKKNRKYEEFESKEPSDTFYATDNRFDIEKPAEGETLLDFIVRLARSIEDSGKGPRLGYRALKSFVDFIRKTHPIEQAAFIEHIFPRKMDLHFGKIIRIISPEAYPIPEKTAVEILMELARRCRSGRPDTRHTAAESLGLSWLCIIASRIRLPIHLETVKSIKSSAVQFGADFPALQVPTWFGEQPINISHRIATFLTALSHIPSKQHRDTILQRPMRSLTRMLNDALQSVDPNPEYGNITYLSLLNQPHIFGDYRYQPKHQITK